MAGLEHNGQRSSIHNIFFGVTIHAYQCINFHAIWALESIPEKQHWASMNWQAYLSFSSTIILYVFEKYGSSIFEADYCKHMCLDKS